MKKLLVLSILFLFACQTKRLCRAQELQPGLYPRKGCGIYPKPKFK